ncbi:MAG: RNA polymerase sigma factor [Thermoguttaceae bacterium]|jgi:RNA polymerase sigma-70 factor (ECF subfamily)
MEESSETYTQDEDTRLMMELKAGDASAFEELMTRNQPKVLSMLVHFVGSRQQAEDLTQEVFLNVYRSRETYQPTAKFSTWLYRIVHNLALNAIRSKKRRPELLFGGAVKEGGESGIEGNILAKSGYIPTRHYDKKEEREMVHLALQSLNERQREVLLFRHFEGMKYEQIAEVMNLTPQAVKSLLCRARQRLAEIMTPYMKEGSLPQ